MRGEGGSDSLARNSSLFPQKRVNLHRNAKEEGDAVPKCLVKTLQQSGMRCRKYTLACTNVCIQVVFVYSTHAQCKKHACKHDCDHAPNNAYRVGQLIKERFFPHDTNKVVGDL